MWYFLYKVARSLKSMDETLVCGPSLENNFVFFFSLELFCVGVKEIHNDYFFFEKNALYLRTINYKLHVSIENGASDF